MLLKAKDASLGQTLKQQPSWKVLVNRKKRRLLTYSPPRSTSGRTQPAGEAASAALHSWKLKPKGRREKKKRLETTFERRGGETTPVAAWEQNISSRPRKPEILFDQQVEFKDVRRAAGSPPVRHFNPQLHQKTCSTAVESSNTWDQSVLFWKTMLTNKCNVKQTVMVEPTVRTF